MAAMSEELLNALSNEMAIYKKLNEHAAEKTEHLVKNNMDKVKEITDKEQILLQELTKAERKRADIVETLKDIFGDPDLTLSKIAQRLPSEERKRFVDLKISIVEVLDSLKDRNRQNEMLIKEGLNITEYTLNAIQSQGNRMMNNSYGNEVGYGSSKNLPRYFEYRS
ncbi:MAG: flagellar protein FlgN [Clostridia bacterium]|nr:flagellar protein FlgN [Clostridia bacterium]